MSGARPDMPGAALRDVYAVLGNPVAHSRSPWIHAAFAAQTGQALHYDRVLCPLDGFEAALRAFAGRAPQPAEGLGPARGCNITVPFKLQVPALAQRLSARAALAGAANLLRFDEDGAWFADNTDGAGLVRDIELHAGRPLAGQRVLLIGAGGAAAGVLGPLLERHPRELTVVNRTAARAVALVARHAALASAREVALRSAEPGAPGRGYDVLVNAGASSLQGQAAPVPDSALRPGSLAVDLMYGAAAEGFLRWAAAQGAEPRDGLGMLVEQAAEAFLVWRGLRPDGGAVLEALRARLRDEAKA